MSFLPWETGPPGEKNSESFLWGAFLPMKPVPPNGEPNFEGFPSSADCSPGGTHTHTQIGPPAREERKTEKSFKSLLSVGVWTFQQFHSRQSSQGRNVPPREEIPAFHSPLGREVKRTISPLGGRCPAVSLPGRDQRDVRSFQGRTDFFSPLSSQGEERHLKTGPSRGNRLPTLQSPGEESMGEHVPPPGEEV